MGRRINLLYTFTVIVVFDQDSVHVAFRVLGIIVFPDFVGQILGFAVVQVSQSEIGVLYFVVYPREKWSGPTVFKLVEAVVSLIGMTERHHVVVQAVFSVPFQQSQAVAGRGAAESAVP